MSKASTHEMASRSGRRSARGAGWRAAVLSCSFLLVMALGSCGDEPRPRSTPPDGGGADPASTPSESEQACRERAALLLEAQPPDDWWQRRVATTIVLSGGLDGKHKPCGCSCPQVGGLERLAALVDRLVRRARGNVVPMGLGWYMDADKEISHEEKGSFIRESYQALGFKGLLLGTPDLRVDTICQPFDGGGPLSAPRPPLNIRLDPGHVAAPTMSQAFLDMQAGNQRLRFASLVSDAEARRALVGAAGQAVGEISVTAALQGLTPDAGRLWVFSTRTTNDQDLETLVAAAGRLGPCVIFDLSPRRRLAREFVEGARLGEESTPLVLALGEKGSHAGVLDVTPDADGRTLLVDYRRIELIPQMEEWTSSSRSEVQKLLGWYQEDLKDGDYVRDFLSLPPPEDEAPFVGSHKCAACHKAIYRQWNATSHAHALDTLIEKNYAYDPECIRCHVVGWRQYDAGGRMRWERAPTGFSDAVETRSLGGVGCENCHGPGGHHVEDPWTYRLFNPPARDAGLQAWRAACMRCHDLDNSHAFGAEFEGRYLPAVDHREVPPPLRTQLPEGYERPR